MDFELPDLCNYVDGKIDRPTVDRDNCLRNPNTREPLQAQLSSSPEQTEDALRVAERAWHSSTWEETPATQRAATLDAIADALEDPNTRERMAVSDALTTGAVINTTRRMARLTPFVFRHAAQFIREGGLEQTLAGPCGDVEYFRRPWGPALLVSPWNGPTAIGSHKIASALAAGAPCIMKPSEWAPHSAIIMAQVIQGMALPPGTFQLVCGSRHVGARMVDDPRIKAISFTGGVAGGRVIAQSCASAFKPLQLELGGNNPLVVFEDADLERAATGIVYGITNLNAQWCRALGRILAHESIKDALLELVSEKLAAVVLGNSLDEQTDMGPLIHQGQYQSVVAEVNRLKSLPGARAISSTALPDLPGYFIAPTLIDGCSPGETTEEIFGPVAAVHSFSNEEQALQLANGTDYGLAAYVYSRDEHRAFSFGRRLRTGSVKVNGYSLLSLSGAAPRGAWGLSGLGEEGTAESIEFFTGARLVGVSAQDALGGR